MNNKPYTDDDILYMDLVTQFLTCFRKQWLTWLADRHVVYSFCEKDWYSNVGMTFAWCLLKIWIRLYSLTPLGGVLCSYNNEINNISGKLWSLTDELFCLTVHYGNCISTRLDSGWCCHLAAWEWSQTVHRFTV